MDLNTVLTRNPNAAFRIYDGQATVVLPERAEVHVVNALGSFIWSQLDGQRPLRDILDRITEEYAVDADEAREDLVRFVADLREHGMVR